MLVMTNMNNYIHLDFKLRFPNMKKHKVGLLLLFILLTEMSTSTYLDIRVPPKTFIFIAFDIGPDKFKGARILFIKLIPGKEGKFDLDTHYLYLKTSDLLLRKFLALVSVGFNDFAQPFVLQKDEFLLGNYLAENGPVPYDSTNKISLFSQIRLFDSVSASFAVKGTTLHTWQSENFLGFTISGSYNFKALANTITGNISDENEIVANNLVTQWTNELGEKNTNTQSASRTTTTSKESTDELTNKTNSDHFFKTIIISVMGLLVVFVIGFGILLLMKKETVDVYKFV